MMGTSCACVPSGNTYDACKSGQLMLLCEAAVFCGDDSIQDKAGLVLLLMAHRLEFVREACKPASFVDSSWKPTGYKVTEISWGVVQNNGQPYMQPGIQTELTLEHSEGEEFVNEQDRRKTGLETVRQKVSLRWQICKVWMQGPLLCLKGILCSSSLTSNSFCPS